MKQHFPFDNSGAPVPAHARPYSSCVWAIRRHCSQNARQPHFTPAIPTPTDPERSPHPARPDTGKLSQRLR
jgi:hypothetical protein